MREFGSEFPSITVPDGYFDSLKKFGNDIYLRSGREALALIARSCKKDKTSTILFPAYCCWSMSTPFEHAGWNIVYYRLNPDLSVDNDYMEQLLQSRKPDAVLLMNFFGITPTDTTVNSIKSRYPECLCIEDFSHCLLTLGEIYNPLIDYYAASIRKSLGVCDGGIVISNRHINTDIIREQDTVFSELRYEAQCEKHLYDASRNPETKQMFRDKLQTGERILDEFDGIHAVSDRAATMLRQINAKEIVFIRRQNQNHLISRIKNIPSIRLLPIMQDIVHGMGGFSLPILVNDRDVWQRELAAKGLFAPVLWPISDTARDICPIAARMADCMLSLPIDQRYDYEDIEQIAGIISQTHKQRNA